MKIRVMISLVLLSLLPLTSVAQTGDSAKFDRLVPDDASFVLLVDDVPEFLGAWPESPLGWPDAGAVRARPRGGFVPRGSS